MGTAIDAAIWWVGLFGGCNYFIVVVVVIIMFTFHFCFRLRYEKNWRLQKVKGHDRNIGVGCITYIHTLEQTNTQQ